MTANITSLQVTQFAFSDISSFSSFAKDFASESATLKPYLNGFFDVDKLEEHIKLKQENYAHRSVLHQALTKQLQGLALSSNQADNLEVLAQENTFTITTGHQLSLFNGPMYFIYKILQVAKTCETLTKKYPNYNFVPIFWMASEDHDFEEIRKANVFGKTLELAAVEQNYAMVGTMPASILKPAIEELVGYLETASFGKQYIDELKTVFEKSKTLTDFTRNLVSTWFKDFGVLPLDGDDKALKACFKDLVKKEVETNFSFKACSNTNKTRGAHYKTQVEPREINLFYIDGNERRRIVSNGDNFELLGTTKTFTKEQLLHEVDENPQLFSPNVILRPLYQELILPNLAYCGGGGEIAYWTQLKDVFVNANVLFPKLILRNSIVLVDAGVHKKMAKLGLENKDLFVDTFTLQENYLKAHSDVSLLNDDKVQSQLEKLKQEMLNYVSAIDTTLQGSVEGSIAGQKKFIDGLQKKLKKQLKQQEEVSLKQIEGVKEKIYPSGVFQERFEHPYRYLSKYGKAFFTKIYETIEPNKSSITYCTY